MSEDNKNNEESPSKQDSLGGPDSRQPVIRVLATPNDTNSSGDVFGGWLMSQVDIAGSILAHRRADGRVVTVAVNSFRFLKPVYVGDLVSCYAKIDRIGRTSITISVEVIVDRNRLQHQRETVAESTLTYVAIDKDRQPREVQPDKA